MNARRLYRCRHDRQIAGVAAGMAEYFELDPTVVRIAWILSVLFGGVSILLYAVLAFVIPLEPEVAPGTVAAASATDASATDASAAGAASNGGTADGAAPGERMGNDRASAPAHRHGHVPAARRQPGNARLVFGVLLVVFGGLALAGELVPGIVLSGHLGPAFVLALGIAIVVGAVHRPAVQS